MSEKISLVSMLVCPYVAVPIIIGLMFIICDLTKKLRKYVKIYISFDSDRAMEDGVPFKVFLYMGGSKPEIRRFCVDKLVSGKIKTFVVKIREVYPKLKIKNFTLAWKDEDDDEILLSSDHEIETMYMQCHDHVIKLIIRCIGPKNGDNDDVTEETAAAGDADPVKTNKSNAVHRGITCDVCGSAVVGFRYKCITCDDYDLCVRCENDGKHPEHCVVRVPVPNLSLPLIKATIKKSRRFLKSYASQAHEESKKLRRELGKPTSEQFQNIQGKQGSQPGVSRTWVQIFCKYLEEFTNLAGNSTHFPEKPESERKEPSTSDEAISELPSSDAISMNPWNLPQEDLEKLHHACKFMRENAMRTTLKPLSNAFSKILEIAATSAEEATAQSPARASSPLREMTARKTNRGTSPQSQEAEQQASLENRVVQKAVICVDQALKNGQKTFEQEEQTSNTLPEDGKPIAKPTTSGKGTPDAEVPVDNGKNCDIPDFINEISEIAKRGELSSNASSCSEGHGSDKAEGWTVVDETMTLKDPFYVSIENLIAHSDTNNSPKADGLINPDILKAAASVKGKLQGKTKDNLRIIYPSAKPAPIYPPLNTATAVLDPNQTSAASAAAASAPPPSAETSSAPNTKVNHAQAAKARAAQAAITAQHLRAQLAPHVEAAVHQMESMGFSNESGWLTQLLDHNDGNIAKVLDLITPGIPPPK